MQTGNQNTDRKKWEDKQIFSEAVEKVSQRHSGVNRNPVFPDTGFDWMMILCSQLLRNGNSITHPLFQRKPESRTPDLLDTGLLRYDEEMEVI